MSKRTRSPVLLLIAAACSLAAVFGVQRIEARGGPFGEPYATRFFSPNDDGRHDVANIRFTVAHPERVTIEIRTEGGNTVRTQRIQRVRGPQFSTWDGTDDAGDLVPDGTYQVVLKRAGDRREYGPIRRIKVDTTPPRAVIDRAREFQGSLIGLAAADPGTVLVFVDGEELIKNIRVYRPAPGADSGRFDTSPPEGTEPLRFKVPLPVERTSLTVYAQDRAGNRRQLHLAIADRNEVGR